LRFDGARRLRHRAAGEPDAATEAPPRHWPSTSRCGADWSSRAFWSPDTYPYWLSRRYASKENDNGCANCDGYDR
jgi:hypothetical protein